MSPTSIKTTPREEVDLTISPILLTQKAAMSSTPSTTTPCGARRTTSPRQAPSPTSELAAQLEDLVFTGQKTPGAQLRTPPKHLTTHDNDTRVLRSRRQVSQVKKKAKDDQVGLDAKGGKGKGDCSSVPDSAGSGRGGNMAAGEGKELTVIESPAAGKRTRSKGTEGKTHTG